jgi:outer membrane protein OmpA-like peptidoglycan-associated protein
MRNPIALIPWLLALASCSSPPKPPTAEESRKRPVNTQMAVELQVCRNDLQNTRLLATESGRVADATATRLAQLAARQQMLASVRAASASPAQARPELQANGVYTVRFEYGSARFEMPTDVATSLVKDAKASPLILLRGRTDGSSDAPAESRIARNRAAAVRDYLVAAGIDPARIRATYQPAGDHVAENITAGGRGLNRRVEIELYRALPVAWSATVANQP